MNFIDQKICVWGGPWCALFFGAGLLLAGFVPPPSPTLSADEVAAIYQSHPNQIRSGIVLCLVGIAGYAAFIGPISVQLRRIQGTSRLPAYVQLSTGAIGVLTVMFPMMVLGAVAFRPDRDPQLTQMLHETGWLLIIAAFPTFLAQFGSIAIGILQDKNEKPVFPRWVAYFNVWVGLLFIPGGFAFFFYSGPFAYDGLLAFWIAASAFFAWLVVMTPVLLRAIGSESPTA